VSKSRLYITTHHTHTMSKRHHPITTSAISRDGPCPAPRSKRAKLEPLLPHERDYLSLPTSEHRHRYDLRVRPPRPNHVINGRQARAAAASPLREAARWRNAHSYSLNHQRLSNSSTTSNRRRPAPQLEGGSPQRKRRRQTGRDENELVSYY